MAERRMFTKKVTDDDNFMSLSSSAQALYLHLSMSADDDGFCNQVSISMFKAHASVQDLQALLEKRYIYQFENGVIVIKHWRMANALRKDRYTPTAFKEELAQLDIKKNGSYTMTKSIDSISAVEEDEENLSPRKLAYKRSSLPYSFDYKIKNAFYGKECPVCRFKMQKNIDETGIVSENRLPTIQHNKPISQGGEHELGNISVICHQCNVSIQDTETDELNAQEVIDIWEQISGCRLVATCLPQVRLGKDRLGKDSIDNKESKPKRFTPPSLEDVQAYCLERNNNVDAERFIDYYQSNGWMVGRNKMKDWKSAVRTWEKNNYSNQPKKQTEMNGFMGDLQRMYNEEE